jgi:YVTN family beta-propeller protein
MPHASELRIGLIATLMVAAVTIAPTYGQNPLNTGKSIAQPPLGTQFNVGSLPMNIVLSPNGKFAVASDMGFRQYLWSLDAVTGQGVSNIAFNQGAGQPQRNGLYYGLAFDPQLGPDNTYTLYAGMGGAARIAVVKLDADSGQLTHVDTVLAHRQPVPQALFFGDFPAGVALDQRNLLYVTNNTVEAFVSFMGSPFQVEKGSVAIYDRTTKLQVGRYEFVTDPVGLHNYPLGVAVLNNGSKVYVGSQRDGKVYAINATNPAAPALQATIATGAHPTALLLNAAQSLLFVANAHSDSVSVIDTTTDTVIRTILFRPVRNLLGATPTGLALSPDETSLYVTLGDMNAVAVADVASGVVRGYIPAGWYPSAIIATQDGQRLLFTNAKGTTTRNPNPDGSYILNIIEGNASMVSVPDAATLAQYTRRAFENNRFRPAGPDHNPLYAISREAGKIRHVIYIVKENRTYDQVLSDLPLGNNDPSLLMYGYDVTPNQHALAERFVQMDNFFVCGEASGDGWPWSTHSFANEYVIKNLPYNYSGRGRQYDFEGQNNGYIVGGHPATDIDGNLLSLLFPSGAPPITDVIDTPSGAIWDQVRRHGLSYRNYGFHLSSGFSVPGLGQVLPDNYPASPGVQPEGRDLAGISNYDFRKYDENYADSDGPHDCNCPYPMTTYGHYNMPSRIAEFRREFDQMIARDPNGSAVPNFMTVRLMNDHTSGFSPGRPSPRAMIADNDYAVGQLVEIISNSPIWEHAAIFVIEDDAQDGPDHVDAHRSIAFVASPYIRAATLDSTFYNTDSVLRTMELLLNIPSLSHYDRFANHFRAFEQAPNNNAPFVAIRPDTAILCERNPTLEQLEPGSLAYMMAVASAGMNFASADSANPRALNEILWKLAKGLDSKMPEPVRGAPVSPLADEADEDDDERGLAVTAQ